QADRLPDRRLLPGRRLLRDVDRPARLRPSDHDRDDDVSSETPSGEGSGYGEDPSRDPPVHLPLSGKGPRRPLSGGARSAPRSSRFSSRADARSRRARPVPRRAAVEAPPHSGPAPRDGRSPSVPARDLRRFVLAARTDGRFAGGILFGARRLPSLTG